MGWIISAIIWIGCIEDLVQLNTRSLMLRLITAMEPSIRLGVPPIKRKLHVGGIEVVEKGEISGPVGELARICHSRIARLD